MLASRLAVNITDGPLEMLCTEELQEGAIGLHVSLSKGELVFMHDRADVKNFAYFQNHSVGSLDFVLVGIHDSLR